MASGETPRILVAGGDRDPNLQPLVRTLSARKVDFFCLEVGTRHPWLCWDIESNRLVIDGREMRPRAAFVRHDVFTNLADPRPATAQRAFAWYTAITGWIAANEQVRFLNRASMHAGTNKPWVLHLARACGLAIPATLVTNHLDSGEAFLPGQAKIAKPVNGGGYCQRLDGLLTKTKTRGERVAASPAILQSELIQPEYRVYRIDDQYLGFAVISDELDYRVNQNCRVEPWPDVPRALSEGLTALCDRLGLRFAAADFKTCPRTGQLLFLEVNSGPMFAAFDQACGGRLTAAIADFLENEPPDPAPPTQSPQ